MKKNIKTQNATTQNVAPLHVAVCDCVCRFIGGHRKSNCAVSSCGIQKVKLLYLFIYLFFFIPNSSEAQF